MALGQWGGITLGYAQSWVFSGESATLITKQSDSVAGHFSVNGFSDFENAIQSE